MRGKLSLAAGAVALALLLGACASVPTGYTPAQSARGDGYREQRVEANRFLISVRGNFNTERARVEQILLLRAADLTLENGYDHFILAGRTADVSRNLTPVGGDSRFGWSWYSPRWGWRWWNDPIWSDAPSYLEVSRFEVTADVAMFKGAKPAGDANAYDARSVRESIGPAVTAPPR